MSSAPRAVCICPCASTLVSRYTVASGREDASGSRVAVSVHHPDEQAHVVALGEHVGVAESIARATARARSSSDWFAAKK